MYLLNNREETLGEGGTITSLFQLKEFHYKGIVVKINGKVIKEELYDEIIINPGDNVLALHICHGG